MPVILNFNPRTREGCDLRRAYMAVFHGDISIHAPVKGATLAVGVSLSAFSYFNPRTREGCDSLQIGSVTICSLINHIAN